MRRRFAVLPLFVLLAALGVCAQAPINPDEGRPQVRWEEARQVVGKTAFVSGKVLNVSTAGRITFINFDEQRPTRFVAVIFDENLANFPKPPNEMYSGKILRVRGPVTLFRNQPQIAVTSPEQIEILATLPGTTAAPQPIQRTQPGQIVVAAYNSLNLFDDVDDPYREDEGTPAKPRDQMMRWAQSIEALNADVIALEEVENRDYLQRFVDVFLPDLGYKEVVLFEGNDGRGIDVALISRVPIGQVRSNRHLKFAGADGAMQHFQRDLLQVTVEPEGGEPFEMWVVHLKSKRGDDPGSEVIRVAEASEIRRQLDERLKADPEARIIVTGDFNDLPGSKTVETIVGAGPLALWSAHTDLANPEVDTYNTGDYKSMIDYMFCSPAMRQQYVKGSFHVPQGSIPTTGSDHNPIVATFKTN